MDWITHPSGLRMRIVGDTMEWDPPEGMSQIEAVAIVQDAINYANSMTGEDIQMKLPEE